MPDVVKYSTYTPCSPEFLKKIKIGWNIGMCDYRNFKYNTGIIRNYIISNPHFNEVNKHRTLAVSLRGTLNYGNPEISFQRNKLILELTRLKNEGNIENITIGAKISQTKYINELINSKISISPYGWGEICYRDYESILAGAILLKPNMDHLETFPNIYTSQNYISLNWDLSNLSPVIENCIKDYENKKKLAINAQSEYSKHIHTSELFVENLKSALEI